MQRHFPVIIIGGGQAGLSSAYFLARQHIEFVILDANPTPGGSWTSTWPSLKLFSPAHYSSLSGWPLPQTQNEYPSKDEFIEYLTKYEARYGFQVHRNTKVTKVEREAVDGYKLTTNNGEYYAQAIVVATGTASGAVTPEYPGAHLFQGEQLHSIHYSGPEPFLNKRVLVVGAGNTGAQLFSELILHTDAHWTSHSLPKYLPDHLDGRYLFERASEQYLSLQSSADTGKSTTNSKANFGNIVMVDSVKQARDKGLLTARLADFEFTAHGVRWASGQEQHFDAVIWATGFKANLSFLAPLDLMRNGKIETEQTKVVGSPGLWLVGLGDWTGFASATIYGVGKTARDTAQQISYYLR